MFGARVGGVIPEGVSWAPWSKDPHNLYVQILADGGLWGLGLFLLALIVLVRSIKSPSFVLPSLAFAAGLFVYQGVDRIWAISSGLFLILSAGSYFSDLFESQVDDCRLSMLIPEASDYFLSGLTFMLSLLCPCASLLLFFAAAGRP